MNAQITLNDKIGIIAGSGPLPKKLCTSLKERNIIPYVLALKDVSDDDIGNYAETKWNRLGAAGKTIDFFKDNGVRQIVLVGGMKRPKFTTIIPDITGIKLLNKILHLHDAGDNKLFELIIEFLESYGLTIMGIDDVVPELVASKGVMGKVKPDKEQLKDIEYGKHIAQEIGRLDIGQAVIVQNGTTIGVEGIEGTDELIKRCASLRVHNRGGVLIKMKKPTQDRRIDLPSIGPATIERLHEKDYKGLTVDAGNSLIIDREETIRLADSYGIFVYGV